MLDLQLGRGQRHFLDIDSLSLVELSRILEAAQMLKLDPRNDLLRHKMLAAIFEKPSTRTRASFSAAVYQMGGSILSMSVAEMQLGRGESIADTARVLSGYADLILLRTDDAAKLLEWARHARVPVINGLTNESHPCQIMADVLCLQECKGDFAGLRVAWSGAGNNMAASWVHAAVKFGFALHLACPEELPLASEVIEWAHQQGGDIALFDSSAEAVAGCDCIVTDVWVSMGDIEGDFGGGTDKFRHNFLRPYQVNEALMGYAKSDAIFMHCLPAHRGEEVESAVIDGVQSVVWQEAENRLHVQKAIMLWCLNLL